MNNELLLLIRKRTDRLIEQRKTCHEETLEFKLIKKMETFSLNPPVNVVERGRC